MDGNKHEQQGEHFSTAIARHQLELQTELKRSTSLPSSMFDASDPMLEARLCEATEGLFRRLLEHDAPPEPSTKPDVRLEPVRTDELIALLQRAIAGDFGRAPTPELAEHDRAEFHAILAETVARSHGTAQLIAAQLLRSEAGDTMDADVLQQDLQERLCAAAPDLTPNQRLQLAAICRRIADTVLQLVARNTEGPRA